MPLFDALNTDPTVIDILNRIYRGRNSVRLLSGRGVTGADGQSHHLHPVESLMLVVNERAVALVDSPSARFLLLLNQQAIGGRIDPSYRFNRSQNIQVLPRAGNQTFAPNVATHTGSHPAYTAFEQTVVDSILRDSGNTNLRQLLNDPDAYRAALFDGQITDAQRAALVDVADRAHWTLRYGLVSDPTHITSVNDLGFTTYLSANDPRLLRHLDALKLADPATFGGWTAQQLYDAQFDRLNTLFAEGPPAAGPEAEVWASEQRGVSNLRTVWRNLPEFAGIDPRQAMLDSGMTLEASAQNQVRSGRTLHGGSRITQGSLATRIVLQQVLLDEIRTMAVDRIPGAIGNGQLAAAILRHPELAPLILLEARALESVVVSGGATALMELGVEGNRALSITRTFAGRAFNALAVIDLAGVAIGAARGDFGFNFTPEYVNPWSGDHVESIAPGIEYLWESIGNQLTGGDRHIAVGTLGVPREVGQPGGPGTAYDTQAIMNWITTNLLLPEGYVFVFNPAAPGSVPTYWVDDTRTPERRHVQVYFRVPPGPDSNPVPGPNSPAALVVRVDGRIVEYTDLPNHTTAIFNMESEADAAALASAIGEAVDPNNQSARAQAVRDAIENGSPEDLVNAAGIPPGTSSTFDNGGRAPELARIEEAQRNLRVEMELNLALSRMDFERIAAIESAGQVGIQIASALGRVLPIEDPFARAAASALLATIGENIAEAIEAGGIEADLATGGVYNVLSNAWAELGANLLNGGASVVSSILVADLIDSIGLDGTLYGDWLQTSHSQYLTTVITNLPAILQGNFSSLANVNPANLLGAFIGTQLAAELVEFESIGGQIGAAIGSAVGTAIGTSIGMEYGAQVGGMIWGPLGAAIGAFIGYIVGGLIGSLFGGTPKAGAEVRWDAGDQQFEVGRVWSKNGGSKDAVRAMAGHVGDLLNGVIAASGSRIADVSGIQVGAYDQKGSRFTYKPSMAGDYAFSSKDLRTIVLHGAYIALSDLSERLVGGDVYVKRALSATLAQSGADRDASGEGESGSLLPSLGELGGLPHIGIGASRRDPVVGDFEIETLFGNIATAQDYANYLQNASIINAFIAAEPESAFTAGWTINFARVIELGLDRRWRSDWLGGWAAFLDETSDGKIDGGAFSPGAVFLELDPETNERLFVFADQDGALLGVLGDTIDTASKDVIAGTAGADAIMLSEDSWTETRTVTETVTVSPERTFFNRRTNSTFTIDPGTVFENESIELAEGVWLVGENTVEVTRDVVLERNGWRVSDAAGLTSNGEAIASGPSDQIRIAALIDGGAGGDTIRGGDLGNDLLGGDGNDTLIGGALDDWQFGGAGNDRLFAGDVGNVAFSDTATDATSEAARDAAVAIDGGNGDYLDGGEGEDAIYGGRGSDWLNGGAGVDVLHAGAGGDILDGGAGDDRGAAGEARLLGGAGSDQYVFYRGTGNDVIFDSSDPAAIAGANLYTVNARYAFLGQNPGARNWAGNGEYEVDGSVVGGEDAISFGPGIGMEDLILRRGTTAGVANSDLIIAIALRDPAGNFIFDANGARIAGPDSLTIKDWYDETRRVEWFRFADGQDIRIGDISSFIVGSALGDSIVGTDGNDWVVGLGGGDDIKLLDGDDFGFGGRGNDIVSGDEDEDLVSGGDDNDIVSGGDGHDAVFGDAGDDVVSGNAGNDIVAGGRGDDEVYGGTGNDLYRFWRDDGHDTMYDEQTAVATEVAYQNGQWVNGYEELPDGRIVRNGEVIYDGETWAASFGWDYTTSRLMRRLGEPAPTTTVDGGPEDTLEFGFGIDIEDVQLMKVGDDLELAIAGGSFDASAFFAIGDRITFREWYSVPGQIERFVFVETGMLDLAGWKLGATVGQASDGDDVQDGALGQDWITGGLGDDVIRGLAADDILSGNHGGDRIEGGAGKDVIYGGADDDVIDGGVGADLIFGGAGYDIASYASITGTGAGVQVSLAHAEVNTRDAVGDVLHGIEGLEGTHLNDELWGDTGDNTLRGLGGNDLLKGDVGDDTYEVNTGQGDDIIQDSAIHIQEIVTAAGVLAPGYEADWQFIGIEFLWGSFWRVYRLTVTDSSGGIVYQSGEHDFVYQSIPDVPLPSPAAWPFSGWTVPARRIGVGVVVETAPAGDAGYDTLEVGPGVSLSDITATRPNTYDARLAFAQGGSVTLRNQNLANNGVYERAVDELILDDGLTANLASLKLRGEAATDGDDLFLGGAADGAFNGNDSFNGGLGDDVISGGAGDDTLIGGDGDDALEGGAGGDILDGGADSVTADHAALEGNALAPYGDTIRYVRSGAGIVVDLAANTVSGRDATTGTAAAIGDAAGDAIVDIENVVGSEGYADNLYGDGGANRLTGLGGNDRLEGRDGDDILSGGAGTDTILGGDGADALAGGADNDSIDGGNGADAIRADDGVDSVHGGAGADLIYAGAGSDIDVHGDDDNDRLYGEDGADTLRGDGGDDVLDGGADNDTLEGGAGADTLVGGAGVDTLKGGAGDDAYVFDASSGVDTIVDAEGASNSLTITGVAQDAIWLTRSGDDLRIGVIGGDTLVTVAGYFLASGGSKLNKVTTDTHTLYLAHASDLIAAMTLESSAPPTAAPPSIVDQLATYWTEGVKAVPRLAHASVALDEDGSASGVIATIDPDDQALTYALQQGPAHGTLDFDPVDHSWTYQPDANWNGVDGFDVAVTDTDGQTVIERVTLNVAAVNDAPMIEAPTLSVAENAATGTVVGQLNAADPEGDAVTFSQQSNASGRFAVSATGQITVIDGALLDFEAGASYQIDVSATDAGGAASTRTVTISLADVNEAPTALALANAQGSVSEATSTTSRVKVADLVVTDDALGSETFALSGADAASFEVHEGALYLRAGVALNYEAKTSYQVTVTVDDPSVGSSADASQSFTLAVTDANEAPTALALANVTGSLSDTVSTASRVHIADLVVSDDALGSEALGVAGADAEFFEIHNGALYLKAGVTLNAATQSSYEVSVTVDDAELGSGAELIVPFTLNVGAGLALSFDNIVGTLPESTPTATRVKVADLIVADDVGTPVLGLAGADASAFEIYDGGLYLKAGTGLNFESKTTYQVTVTMDDPSVGSGVDLTRDFTLTIGDANEVPTAVTFANTTTVLAENTSTAARIKVADLAIVDDALGSESLGLSGADAAAFEIDGSTLYLKEGVVLNYEAKSSYSVNVTVDDPTVGGAPDVAQAFTLTVTDINEAPTAISLTNTTTSMAESTSTAARTKVADLVIADDALGSETISLTGADASSFEIYNGALYLKAGVALNYEAKASYAVTVTVDDPTVGSTPDLSQAFTLSITDINEAPSAVSFANTTTTVAENTSTGNRIKVADIVVADDALGAETLSLSGADAASFEIDGAVLYLKAGVALNREAKSSYSVTVNVNDASVGATPDAAQSFTLAVSDVNEAVSLNWAGSSAQVTGAVWTASTHTLAVPETVPTGVTIGRIAASDLDVGAFANFRFELTGANASLFTINAVTGDIALAAPLNYEAATHAFSVGVTVWDGGAVGAGLSASGTFTIDALNVNEAPVGSGFWYYFGGAQSAGTTVGTVAATDPEGSAVTYSIYAVSKDVSYQGEVTTTSLATSTYTVNSAGVVTLNTTASLMSGRLRTDTITIQLSDTSGNVSYATAHAQYDRTGEGGGGGVIPPIVLDLNGDGVTLVPFADSPVAMDANADGLADHMGWVGADDGLLALDRNGDGVIAGVAEISFAHDVEGAASDLEGLRAYDTNSNGFLDPGDARFAEFRVWQDANQDGVAQAEEVTDLAGRQVVAINLTLTPTGQSPNGASDNVLYGTASYVRTDGTLGAVGDVFLYYVPTVMQSGVLPPIVLDLDGDGISLTSRLASTVTFDADNDGDLERVGWFGAGEGVLALDRNSDGLITMGSEISFTQDVEGARTDLEGLRAFDSNENGFFDEGDARYGEFRIWRDANQDGVSQAGELRSLADWNIVAINLTLNLTGASLDGANDNAIYATTQFVRGDGSRGTVGDVFLSFDESVPSEPAPSGDDTPGGLRCLTPDPTGDIKTPRAPETDPSAGGDDTPDGLRCLTPGPLGDIKTPGGGQSDPLPRGPFGLANVQNFFELLEAYREGLIPRERFGLRNLLGLFGDRGDQDETGGDSVGWCGTTPDKTPDRSSGDGLGGPSLGVAGEGIGDVDRTAQGGGSRRQSASGAGADPLGWISANELPLSAADPAAWIAELAEANRRVLRQNALSGVQPPLSDVEVGADDAAAEPFALGTDAPASQLHRRLGLADRQVLHMINAMAGFEATSASDLARSSRQRDPKVAAMLTALPDIR